MGKQTTWVKVFLLVRVTDNFLRVLRQLRASRSLKMNFTFKANIVSRFIRPMLAFRELAYIDNNLRLAKR